MPSSAAKLTDLFGGSRVEAREHVGQYATESTVFATSHGIVADTKTRRIIP